MVLTMTLTGLASDSVLAGGPGAKPHRWLGSVVAMLVGAALGGCLLEIFAPVALAFAAVLVALVAGLFAVGRPARELTSASS
jgi:hypothetical protein